MADKLPSPNIALHVKIVESNDGSAIKIDWLVKDADDPAKRYPARISHVRGLLLSAAMIIGNQQSPADAKSKTIFDED